MTRTIRSEVIFTGGSDRKPDSRNAIRRPITSEMMPSNRTGVGNTIIFAVTSGWKAKAICTTATGKQPLKKRMRGAELF